MPLLSYDTLTFDCYGTLIDWEAGLLRALAATLPGVERPAGEVLETFARFEAEEEAASPALPYPEILSRVHHRLAEEWCLERGNPEAFGASVGDWPAFPDSRDALRILERHYRLVILSNVDRRSFASSQARLGVDFDFVFTAEDIGSYKPDPRNFAFLLDRLGAAGVGRERILHTAQSLFHDHQPAASLGLATCWIDRRHDLEGWGATPPPATEVAVDFRFRSLGEMAAAIEAEAALLKA